MNVLVTGGTGTLGREVVEALRASGHRARVLSRRSGTGDDWVQGDLATGAGLDRAVDGMQAIVHAASAGREPLKTRATDVEGTRRLIDAAVRARVRHLVYISIVGIDGVAYPYYRDKLAAERLVKVGGVPWSILRATQFHSFIDLILAAIDRFPRLLPVPKAWQFQPVDGAEVAARLVELVTGEPAGVLPDFGGPSVRRLDDLARLWLDARHVDKRLVNLPLPFNGSRQVAAGRLTCPEHRDGSVTFEQYLQRRYAR